MKKYLFLLAIEICGFRIVAQTSVLGGLVSGKWTLAGSPYLIQGAIQIPNDSTLTIEPGVNIEFQGAHKLNVQGRLLAIGTSTDSIVFTASNPSVGWRGIDFNNTPTTNDSSKIIYCKIQYGKSPGTTTWPDDYGGAIFIYTFSKVIVSFCSISNSSAQSGGAIYISHCSPVISNNTIFNNIANAGGGGGIDCEQSYAIINNNIIKYNNANQSGGGINSGYGNITINNNIIYGNSAGPGDAGGGISCYNATITNNVISNNSTDYIGGGIYCPSDSSPTISNNIICNNTSANYGGGIGLTIVTGAQNTAVITNNTIVNNKSAYGGALACFSSSNPTLRNNVLWGNTATSKGIEVYIDGDGSDPNFYYCNVEGGTANFEINGNSPGNFYLGTYQNNLNTNPLFVSPSGGSGAGFNGIAADWSLQAGSPCIDAGDPSGVYPPTDIAGNIRVSNGIINIGAHEGLGTVPFIQSPTICPGQNLAIGNHIYNTSGTYKDTLASFQSYDSVITTHLTVLTNCTTGIADNNSEAIINVYPIPTSGYLTLSVPAGKGAVTVFNILGECIYRGVINKLQTEIDLSSQPNGIYFVNIETNVAVLNERIAVSH